MKKTGRKLGEAQKESLEAQRRLRGLAWESLWDTVMYSGLAFVEEELEKERAELCGQRYVHLAERQAVRFGQVPSSLVLGGRRVTVGRPRARSSRGHELSLPSWEKLSSRDPLDQRALEQMVVGVSTRGYGRSWEALPAGFSMHGISQSTISERFVAGSTVKLEELTQRRLEGLELLVLMIDGVHFAEHVVLVAVGIDGQGNKHVLGLREGASEKASACKELLAELIERGLKAERSLLVVIDGAKALHKAVTDTFGARVLIHRCQVHKKRNVLEQLPERMRASVKATINQAYALRDYKRAERLLENLARQLSRDYPGAAASLREGLQESLSLMRLELPPSLERVLSSTNLIENLFSRVRQVAQRVKRWQGGTMILRWTVAGVLEAERSFRKLAGYQGLPMLMSKLRALDAALDRQCRVEKINRAA